MSHIPKNLRTDAVRGFVRPAFVVALFAAGLAPLANAEGSAPAASPTETAPAKTAPSVVFIVVRNLAQPMPAEKALVSASGATLTTAHAEEDPLKGREQAFEDLVSSRLSASSGIAVLSRADAVTRLSAAGGRQADLDGDKVDRAFDDRTSALRLAQNLDAAGILSLTIESLGRETLNFAGSGIRTINERYTLRVSWKLLEAGSGSGIVGGTEKAVRTLRQASGLLQGDGDLVNGLLDDAAEKVAAAVSARLGSDKSAGEALKVAAAKRIRFGVGVTARNIFFPELAVDNAGVLRIAQDKTPVQLDGVTVELDGAAIGTAPFSGPVTAGKGLHRLRLSRDGFKAQEMIVNLFDGFNFTASLELDDAGLKRWREQSAFIENLKSGSKLTDAQVAYIRAQAENLKNYGFKIDYKVDSKAFPEDHSTNVNVLPGGVR